jgi:hypothetical protein
MGTISISYLLDRRTASATLPIRTRATPDRACDPITTKSVFCLASSRLINAKASPFSIVTRGWRASSPRVSINRAIACFACSPIGPANLALSSRLNVNESAAVLEWPLVGVKELDARLGEKSRRKADGRGRSVREINRYEHVAVGRLIRIVDNQDWPAGLTQQSLNRGADEYVRDHAPPMPSGHHKIDRERFGLRCNTFGRISGNNLYAMGRLVTS